MNDFIAFKTGTYIFINNSKTLCVTSTTSSECHVCTGSKQVKAKKNLKNNQQPPINNLYQCIHNYDWGLFFIFYFM